MEEHELDSVTGPELERLREAVLKTAAGEDGGLSLEYRRGHELSGITELVVEPGGAYRFSRRRRGGLDPTTGQGHLSPAQLVGLAHAVDSSGLLDTGGSTRLLGDDEIPIRIEIRSGDLRRIWDVWAGDLDALPAAEKVVGAISTLIAALAGS
jgi:hypothetical protein